MSYYWRGISLLHHIGTLNPTVNANIFFLQGYRWTGEVPHYHHILLQGCHGNHASL